MVTLAFMPKWKHQHHQPIKALPDVAAHRAMCITSHTGQTAMSPQAHCLQDDWHTVTVWFELRAKFLSQNFSHFKPAEPNPWINLSLSFQSSSNTH